jgi:hypothetical protein
MVAVARLRLANPMAPAWLPLAVAAGGGWLVVLTGYAVVRGATPAVARHVACGLPPVLVAVAGFCATQPGMSDCPADTPRWLRQVVWAALASAVAALVCAVESDA